MGWTYRDVLTFPAHMGASMRQAAAHLNQPVLYMTCKSRSVADSEASRFRHFRWCLRQRPEVNAALADLEEAYQFRLEHDCIGPDTLLYLRATPTKLSELIDLNPHLAPLTSSECQP